MTKKATQQDLLGDQEEVKQPQYNKPSAHRPGAATAPVVQSDAQPPMAQQEVVPGFEHEHDESDIIMPRVLLMQQMSPACQGEKPTATAGEIRHSMTNDILPEVFTPILFWKEYARFNPRKTTDRNFNKDYEPGQLIWKTKDATDARVIEQCEFGPEGEAPLAVKFFNFLVLFDGHSIPTVLSFSKTSYGAGKNLYSLSYFLRPRPMFDMSYKLTSNFVQGEYSYYVLKTDMAGETPDERRVPAKALWQSLRLKSSEIATEVTDE